jgi:hypothetical protein
MSPPRSLLVALATSLSVACGSSTSGDGGKTPEDSGPASDAARDVTMPHADASPDTTPPVDASEASSDAPASPDASDASPPAEAGTHQTMEVTFYGWDDNCPPGNAIAYPKSGGFPTVHDAAGGIGSYADPISFATDKKELPVGSLVYAPFIEKYLVMEDDCGQCDTDWTKSMKWHIDVWMNSDGTEKASALFACEDQWTQNATTIEIDPPPGRTVTTTPLFDPATNVCRKSP